MQADMGDIRPVPRPRIDLYGSLTIPSGGSESTHSDVPHRGAVPDGSASRLRW